MQTGQLLDYMHRFVGFGSPTAKLWFVGLEQGGGKDIAELQNRLDVWAQVGSDSFADLRDYHLKLGVERFHGTTPKIQQTWAKMIRLALATENKTISTDIVRAHQATEFARTSSNTVVAELMPLPSRTIGDWIYSELGIDSLRTRDAYVETFRPARVKLLRKWIAEAKPNTVVFTSKREIATWTEIAQADFTVGDHGALWARSEGCNYVALVHPTAHGTTNAHYEAVGRALGDYGKLTSD